MIVANVGHHANSHLNTLHQQIVRLLKISVQKSNNCKMA